MFMTKCIALLENGKLCCKKADYFLQGSSYCQYHANDIMIKEIGG